MAELPQQESPGPVPPASGGDPSEPLASRPAPPEGAAQEVEQEAAQRERRRRVLALKQELVGGDLLTAVEVAEILDIHPRTVGEYIREGKLRAFQFGGGWKISASALRAFVQEQTQAPPTLGGTGAPHPIVRAISDVLMTLSPGGEVKQSLPPGGNRGATFKCSFCGKPQEQVERLIAGPNRVFICNQCIALCNEILAEKRASPQPP